MQGQQRLQYSVLECTPSVPRWLLVVCGQLGVNENVQW